MKQYAALYDAGEDGERDLGLGALYANGADETPHPVLLPGEDVLDVGATSRFGGIGLPLGFLLWMRLTRLCRFGHALLTWLR